MKMGLDAVARRPLQHERDLHEDAAALGGKGLGESFGDRLGQNVPIPSCNARGSSRRERSVDRPSR